MVSIASLARCGVATLLGMATASAGGPPPCDPTVPVEPLVLAELQVWHGSDSHDEAYSPATCRHCPCQPPPDPCFAGSQPYDSGDAATIARQIQEAKALGIDGFVINWYGPEDLSAPLPHNNLDRAFQDQATQAVFAAAVAAGDFFLALMYDEGAIRDSELMPEQYQDQAEEDLAYADATYLSSPAYLEIDGKPAVFVFAYDEVTLSYPEIRTQAFGQPVVLLDRDPDATFPCGNPEDPGYDDAFDGFFAWVYPGDDGWDSKGAAWGEPYLQWFYATMASGSCAGKIAVGGVWPGFDDSLAPWCEGRYMARAGCTVYQATWDLAMASGVGIVMIGTWNDFEEGTEIEYGVDMAVDMDPGLPAGLLRNSPVEVTWTPVGGDVFQIYQDCQLICEGKPAPPLTVDLQPGVAYELKLWQGPEPQTILVKARRPPPIFCDGFESGDEGLWLASDAFQCPAGTSPVSLGSQPAPGTQSEPSGGPVS